MGMIANANRIGGGGLPFPKNGLMWSPFFNEAYSVNSGVSVEFVGANGDYGTFPEKTFTGAWELTFTGSFF